MSIKSDNQQDVDECSPTAAVDPPDNALNFASATEKDTSILIAEAAAAAVEAAAVDVDVTATAAASAAALAAEEEAAATAAALGAVDDAQLKAEIHEEADAATGIAGKAETDESIAKKNEQRRKRYREKAVDDDNKEGGSNHKKKAQSHEDMLAARRMKDRQRYANMTAEQRQSYNSKRRQQYHRQSETSRQKRRERERSRYHSLATDDAKERNARRAKLERERYQRLAPEVLEAKNRKRRERAAQARHKKDGDKSSITGTDTAGDQSSRGDAMKVEDADRSKSGDSVPRSVDIPDQMMKGNDDIVDDAPSLSEGKDGIVQVEVI